MPANGSCMPLFCLFKRPGQAKSGHNGDSTTSGSKCVQGTQRACDAGKSAPQLRGSVSTTSSTNNQSVGCDGATGEGHPAATTQSVLKLPCLKVGSLLGEPACTTGASVPTSTCTRLETLQRELQSQLPWAAVIVLSVDWQPANTGPAAARRLQACRCETVWVSQAFRALFRVDDLHAGDAFIDRLLSLHHGARTLFEQVVHSTRRLPADAGPAPVHSIELGGPHNLAMALQPLTLTLTPTGHSPPDAPVPALVIELAFRDAIKPLFQSSARAGQCSDRLGEIAHMFSADGHTCLYQNAGSQAYMGHIWTGLEAHLGLSALSCASVQQQAVDVGGNVVIHISGHQHRGAVTASSATAAPHATAAAAATNWLQRLFALDLVSLEQMMATTSRGEVWRWVASVVGGSHDSWVARTVRYRRLYRAYFTADFLSLQVIEILQSIMHEYAW